MSSTSPFIRTQQLQSTDSFPERQSLDETGVPRRRSGDAVFRNLRTVRGQDRFDATADRDHGRSDYSKRSYEKRRSTELTPMPPRDSRRASSETETDRSYPSTESDKFSQLRSRSRAELEQFRRQAARATKQTGVRTVSAPGGMGTLEDCPTMPDRKHSATASGVNVQVIVQRDHSQTLDDSEAGGDSHRPTRQLSRQDTIGRAHDFLHYITPDTQSRGFRAFALGVKVLLWGVMSGGAVVTAYKVIQNNTDIADNHKQIIGILTGAPAPAV